VEAVLAIEASLIGFAGAVLFLLVDKYETDEMVANLLKFLVLAVSTVAILHKLEPFGIEWF
jgi:hypothetical protein